jgi:hypothetical protein
MRGPKDGTVVKGHSSNQVIVIGSRDGTNEALSGLRHRISPTPRGTVASDRGGAMTAEPRNPGLTWRHRQALAVLARAPPRGRDVNALLTLGFELETMVDLIRDGLATVRVDVVTDRGSKIEIAYVRITDAGGQVMTAPLR